MTRLKSFFTLLLSTLIVPATTTLAEVHRIELNKGWTVRQARLNNAYPATVPGTVHTDLMANGLIEDPFYRLNERGVQWVDKEDWVYTTHFSIPQEVFGRRHLQLHFYGLDTYADVYLNDSLILKADNMFREWKIPVKNLAKQGENKLRIYFHSPIKVDLPKWEALPFQYEAGNDQSANGGIFDRRVSVFARKAGYHYGWDWGPRLVTSGIWRPVVLESWNGERITDVYYEQKSVTNKRATVTAHVKITSDQPSKGKLQIRDKSSGRIITSKNVSLAVGEQEINLPFEIQNPKLWWVREWGAPHLYTWEATWISSKGQKDSKENRIGLRSLRLVKDEDAEGRSFYFELNGYPIFAKGANIIPGDNFLPRVTPERYRHTIDMALAANMNMIRVWGGGIYEDDALYDYCDEKGVLVWQDFTFACSLYPADKEFLDNVRAEAEDNIIRLRNHPSLAIWCGNNEMTQAWYGWGWKKSYEKQSPEIAQKLWADYRAIFHELLPKVTASLDPHRPYVPSSPYSREDGVSEANRGDSHYWEVWHGKVPTTQYNIVRGRFFSEYGFQSFPEMASVMRYAPEKRDHNIYSEVMMSHQRGGAHANGLIETYLKNEYGMPKDFEAFLYLNQLLQGDAIKVAMEAHRRDRPYCMGTLYWQLNDCWPVASWSGTDYYGRWKALHFFARKAYRDLLVSPTFRGDTVSVHIVSDLLQEKKGQLNIRIVDFERGDLLTKNIPVKIPANTSTQVWQSALSREIPQIDLSKVGIWVELVTTTGERYSNTAYAKLQKDMYYPKNTTIQRSITSSPKGYDITLSSDKWIRGAFLYFPQGYCTSSDNYFDIVPGVPVTVHIDSTLSQEDLEKNLQIRSFADSF